MSTPEFKLIRTHKPDHGRMVLVRFPSGGVYRAYWQPDREGKLPLGTWELQLQGRTAFMTALINDEWVHLREVKHTGPDNLSNGEADLLHDALVDIANRGWTDNDEAAELAQIASDALTAFNKARNKEPTPT